MDRELPSPHADYGFFGPDSVTWKVFTYPTSVTLGFQRTVAVEVLDPRVLASVTRTESVMRRSKSRYDRTLQYTAMVAFAGSDSVVQAADTLMRIHARMRGPEPIGGGEYDALDPAGQLWILLTQWHSILYVYEKFGPGRLSPAEELQYWAECAIAAEFQTIDPAEVPRTREGIRAYFEQVRPQLAASEITQQTVAKILTDAAVLLDDLPRWMRPVGPALAWVFRAATISTLPRWMRGVAGVRQGRLTDAAVTAVVRAGFRIAGGNPALQLAFLRRASPRAYPVIAPVLLGLQPARAQTSTPAQAWARAGRPTPRQQWEQLQAAERVAPAPPGLEAEAALPSFG